MFDVGFSEILLFAIVALVVLGPEKLPHAARVAGAWVARIRRSLSAVQAEIEREVSAQELKARLAKEIDGQELNGIARQLQEEKSALEAALQHTENSIAPVMAAATAIGSSDTRETTADGLNPNHAVQPGTPALPGAVDSPPPPVLVEASTAPANIQLDGDAAYREWLESQQRRQNAGLSTVEPSKLND